MSEDSKIAGGPIPEHPAGGDAGSPPTGGDSTTSTEANSTAEAGGTVTTAQQILPLDLAPPVAAPGAPPVASGAPPQAQGPPEPSGPSGASLEAELAEVRRVREDLERQQTELGGVLQRERDSGRLRVLRDMGAIGEVPDQVLLNSAPDVDIHTSEGRAALDTWRQSVPTMFKGEPTPKLTPARVAEGLPVSRNGFWSRAKAEDFIRRNS